jgi:hypothetical protein
MNASVRAAVYTFVFGLLILFTCESCCRGDVPVLVTVNTMENCAPCMAVEAELVRAGTKFVHEYSISVPPKGFPHCFYIGAGSDNGELVFSKKCMFKKTVKLIHYKEGKK